MRTKLIKSEIAKLFNTTKAAIRYYEDKGAIKVEEDKNGYKLYGWEEVEKIEQILFMKNLGISIEEIKKYTNNQEIDNKELNKPIEITKLLEEKRNYIDLEIEKLIKTRNKIDRILEAKNNTELNKVSNILIQERKYLTIKESKYYNLKEFYDISSELYSVIDKEKEEFILLHKGINLENITFEDSKMLLPFNEINHDKLCNKVEIITLPKSNYLTINYIFNDIEDFKIAYKKIIDFAKLENINIDKNNFLEIENKDYKIINKEKMYQLQFKLLH